MTVNDSSIDHAERGRASSESGNDGGVPPAPPSSPLGPRRLLIPLAMGLCFGTFLERSGVLDPEIIIEQFLLRNHVMLVMFMSAAASSSFVHALLSLVLGPTLITAVIQADRSNRGLLASFVGSFLLGMGMTIAGACPGTVVGQVGLGVPMAGAVFASGVLGAALVLLAMPHLRSSGFLDVGLPSEQRRSLDRHTGIDRHWLQLALAAVCGTVVAVIMVSLPVQSNDETSWPTWLCGFLIGTLQVPAILGLHQSLGTSSAYASVASVLLSLVPVSAVRTNPDVQCAKAGRSLWQPLYLIGTVAGAAASSAIAGVNQYTNPDAVGVQWGAAIVGGLLSIVGSRLGDGCTSGHGISGLAQLQYPSIVGTPVMFAAAIATAHVMLPLGLLPPSMNLDTAGA